MGTSLHWYIARHYLGASGGRVLLSLITWIALGGVTVGVSALVVVVAVVSGMQVELRDKILESTPHAYVMELSQSLRLHDWPRVVEDVHAVQGVVGAAPFVLSQVALIQVGPDGPSSRPAQLYGVDVDPTRTAATAMEQAIVSGALSLDPPASGLPPVLLGRMMADTIGASTGDTLVFASFENLTYTFGAPEGTIREFEVTGTFETGMYDYDLTNAYTTLGAAQELLGIEPGTAGGIGVRTADAARAQEIAETLQERLGPLYSVRSWQTQNRALFDNLRLTKVAMQLMLFLIVVVAAFNIVSTLVMVVADRTREIGILRAMGMTRAGIMRVFVLQGAWIGIAGTVLGVCGGVTLAWLIGTYELIRIPPDIYFIDHLPISLRWTDVALIAAGSLAIAFLATLYPAARAAGLSPVEAIRSE